MLQQRSWPPRHTTIESSVAAQFDNYSARPLGHARSPWLPTGALHMTNSNSLRGTLPLAPSLAEKRYPERQNGSPGTQFDWKRCHKHIAPHLWPWAAAVGLVQRGSNVKELGPIRAANQCFVDGGQKAPSFAASPVDLLSWTPVQIRFWMPPISDPSTNSKVQMPDVCGDSPLSSTVTLCSCTIHTDKQLPWPAAGARR